MNDVTGAKDTASFGAQEERTPDPMPERVIMTAPDGRTVQVMTEDIAAFAERGFKLAKAQEPAAEPAPKRRRGKSADADEEES